MPILTTTTPDPLRVGQSVLHQGVSSVVQEVSGDLYRLAGFAGFVPRAVILPYTPPAPVAAHVHPGEHPTPAGG